MSTVILNGEEAIHFAEAHHLTLNQRADDNHQPRDDLSVAEARKVYHEEGGHVWVAIEIGVNSGEYIAH